VLRAVLSWPRSYCFLLVTRTIIPEVITECEKHRDEFKYSSTEDVTHHNAPQVFFEEYVLPFIDEIRAFFSRGKTKL